MARTGLINWFIPDFMAEDAEDYRKSKLVVILCLVGILFLFINVIKWILLGVPALTVSLIIALIVVTSVIFIFKNTGQITITGNIIMMVLSWHFSFLAYLTGGLESHSIFWLVTIPLTSILLLGRKYALIWTGVVFSVIIYFIFAKLTGIKLTSIIPIKEQNPALITGLLGPFLVTFITAIVFDLGQKNALAAQKVAVQKTHETMISLKEVLKKVESGSEQLANSSGELKLISTGLEANTIESTEQANQANESSKEIQEKNNALVSAIQKLNESIHEIEQNSDNALKVAAQAVQIASTTNTVIEQLGKSSEEIAKVSEVIFAIARQTNLLSLNAAIEAAKAGEAGKGFAVVASEVKNLAIKTTTATSDISQRIETIQKDTQQAVEAIVEINEIINKINGLQGDIAHSVRDQGSYAVEMETSAQEAAERRQLLNNNIDHLAKTVENTADAVGYILNSSSSLNKLAVDLKQMLAEREHLLN